MTINQNQNSDREAAILAAQMHILKLIPQSNEPKDLVGYAEALAWMTNPNQPHGGRSA